MTGYAHSNIVAWKRSSDELEVALMRRFECKYRL